MAKERNWKDELANNYSNGMRQLLKGEIDIQKFRHSMVTWWQSFTHEEQAAQKESLREEINNIKRGAEAVTQELYQASVRPV